MSADTKRIALLAAGAIDVGVAVLTAPAQWAAKGLRWYGHRETGPETTGGGTGPADRD